ncbi:MULTISPECIES: hypothetical protein [unclassified Mucilaginibacter]|uniref:hypothetical protein n=1 Tax=unclassified Mucilaginibacter TaxID=2617802 RepID=UPI0031F67F68
MKKTILSIALIASLASSLTSCMVAQDRRGRYNRDNYRGRDHHRDGHRGPYDSNGYRH